MQHKGSGRRRYILAGFVAVHRSYAPIGILGMLFAIRVCTAQPGVRNVATESIYPGTRNMALFLVPVLHALHAPCRSETLSRFDPCNSHTTAGMPSSPNRTTPTRIFRRSQRRFLEWLVGTRWTRGFRICTYNLGNNAYASRGRQAQEVAESQVRSSGLSPPQTRGNSSHEY